LRDLGVKARLYGRAHVGQYVVIDVVGRRILVHEGPSEEGYDRVTVFAEDEAITLTIKPGHEIAVSDLLPPASAELTD
jgi:hypothetical protein